jgi:copper chaperone CopZ
MKNFIITAAAALVAIGASSGAIAAKSVRVQVNGMVCAFCAAAIDKKLSAMPETKAVYVNLEKKVVAIELKDGKTANLDKVRAEVKDAGYDVVSIGETDQTLAQIKAGLK